MVVHGLGGDEQPAGDLVVGQPVADQLEHLVLAAGQAGRVLPGRTARAGRDEREPRSRSSGGPCVRRPRRRVRPTGPAPRAGVLVARVEQRQRGVVRAPEVVPQRAARGGSPATCWRRLGQVGPVDGVRRSDAARPRPRCRSWRRDQGVHRFELGQLPACASGRPSSQCASARARPARTIHSGSSSVRGEPRRPRRGTEARAVAASRRARTLARLSSGFSRLTGEGRCGRSRSGASAAASSHRPSLSRATGPARRAGRWRTC